MPGNLFNVFSVSLLDDETRGFLLQWAESLDKGVYPELSDQELVDAFKNRALLAYLLRILREDLNDIEPAMFLYLFPHQKEAIRRKLVYAHYLHTLQLRIDKIEWRWDSFKINQKQCQTYENLLRQLNQNQVVEKMADPELQLQVLNDASSKPLAYLGAVAIAPMFAQSMVNFFSGKITTIRGLLNEMDRQNTYLGWSRSFILSIFHMIPLQFVRAPGLSTSVDNAGYQLSIMNIIVVNTCLAIELFLVMKNTLRGPWVTRQSKNPVPIWEQFTTQVKQRQFVLLNLFFTSCSDFIGILCLIDVMNVWPWGLLTAMLIRIVQLCLLTMRYDRQKTEYTSRMHQIVFELDQLETKKIELETAYHQSDNPEYQQQLAQEIEVLDLEMQALIRTYQKHAIELDFKNIEFRNHLIYALSIFAGVSLLACMLFPPVAIAPVIMLAISLIGAGLCFAAVVVFSAARGHLRMMRTMSAGPLAFEEKIDKYLDKFIELKSNLTTNKQTNDTRMQMKQIYIEMMMFVIQSQEQRRILTHQKIELMVDILRDVFLPVSALLALIFLPTGIGLAVLAAALLINIFIKVLVHQFAPQAEKQISFDEKAYAMFEETPALKHLISNKNTEEFRCSAHSFLNSKKRNFSQDNQNENDSLLPDINFGE